MSHVNIIISHVDIDKLHGSIIYLAWGGGGRSSPPYTYSFLWIQQGDHPVDHVPLWYVLYPVPLQLPVVLVGGWGVPGEVDPTADVTGGHQV